MRARIDGLVEAIGGETEAEAAAGGKLEVDDQDDEDEAGEELGDLDQVAERDGVRDVDLLGKCPYKGDAWIAGSELGGEAAGNVAVRELREPGDEPLVGDHDLDGSLPCGQARGTRPGVFRERRISTAGFRGAAIT